jgi:plasmid stabilization system protein ParE
MNEPLPIRIVSSAERTIEEAARWWSENRPSSPQAFVNDLENALRLIASHPEIGARARNVKLKKIRRVHLARVHYHLYYRVTSESVIDSSLYGIRVGESLRRSNAH